MFLQEQSSQIIQKKAFVGATVDAAGKVLDVGGKAISGLASVAKSIANGILTAGAFGLVGAGALGGGIGYLAARTSSPDIATSTAEQDVAQEALETEIDIVKRQIAQLERKKAAERRAKKNKVYDRFVG